MESSATAAIVGSSPEATSRGLSSIGNELKLQSEAISALTDKLKELESILPENDDTVSQTINTLTFTVKNLAHNQRALETKLDDLLKNQINTDVAINEISGRLESLMGIFNNGSNLGLVVNHQASSSSMSGHQSVPSTSRGPGRPKKNQTFVTTNLPNGASYSRIQLPMNNINIPKSRRHFTDPNQASLKKEASSTQLAAQEPTPQPPRRRGRPPKNRKNIASAAANMTNVSTAVVTNNNSNNSNGGSSSKRGGSDLDQEIEEASKRLEHQEPSTRGRRSSALSSASANSIRENKRRSTRARRQKNFYDEESEESENISNSEGDSHESDDDKDESEHSHDDALYEEVSGKRAYHRAHKIKDKEKVKTEEEDDDDISESPGAVSKTRRQIELERRRDPREKMLVSMKYSDREKAKSFMESNKDLLKAMKEEERKKRMTAINYEPIFNNSLQQTIRQVQNSAAGIPPPLSSSTQIPLPQSSDSNRTITADASTLSIPNSEPRRMGILSMLNSHEPSPNHSTNGQQADAPSGLATSTTPVKSPSANKRGMTETDSLINTPIKRSKNSPSSSTTSTTAAPSAPASGYTASYTTMTTTMTPSSDINKNNTQVSVRGRPSNATNGSDNSAALLMASPIELVCKDGYFYRRNDLTTAITTGNYLGMKFKNKEEELIKMTMHEEDYAELTRQDRINAYFMKPDIDVETEYACQVLSNVTLTEKYVNSLEYFLMEFRWENRLVSLGLKLRESKRTWQRRKALFALFEFWRDKSREKRGFPNFTILHAVKEMENYRVFINRSVSWFYNHITLLKMILFDLCDNTDTQWREWMFPKGCSIPAENGDVSGITKYNINQFIDSMLTLDFLEDGTENLHTKSSAA